MFSKIITLSAMLAAASTSSDWEIRHGVSTQKIVSKHHAVPATRYGAPVGRYAATVAHYATPVAYYAAPVALFAAPVAHYAATPVTKSHYKSHDTYAPPKYEFSYSVADPHTGDHKFHHESRDGDYVHGYYTLAQPGSTRKVEYTHNGHSGIGAAAHNSAPSAHSAPVHKHVNHH